MKCNKHENIYFFSLNLPKNVRNNKSEPGVKTWQEHLGCTMED